MDTYELRTTKLGGTMKMLEDRILIQTNLSKEELGKEGAKMEAG